MCGIAGAVARRGTLPPVPIGRMLEVLAHRGPDDGGSWEGPGVVLGARRLAILDLSARGHQPMRSADGRYTLVFNGEVYNYLEIRQELGGAFDTGTDTEVALRSLERWGLEALPRFNGQFALALWDAREQRLTAARDRFGERPFYYNVQGGTLRFASEVKALAAAGLELRADLATWATYLAHGLYDHDEATFFEGVRQLPPGHVLTWDRRGLAVGPYYDLRAAVGPALDPRPAAEVKGKLRALLAEAVRLRFRSDVPVGLCLSGGLDSALLLGLVHEAHGPAADLHVHHFATGDPAYDETPWLEELMATTGYPLHTTRVGPRDVQRHAAEVAYHQEAPFGGVPTIANALVARDARKQGTIVVLGGDGVDEAWAGYDYYRAAADGPGPVPAGGSVQASRSPSTMPGVLGPALPHAPPPAPATPFPGALQNWRHRDLTVAKLPRSLRFLDRAFAMHSTERRAPFLDHRLVELGLRQPVSRLLRGEVTKALLREVAAEVIPPKVALAPKRAVQTPQREWLRGELRDWAEAHLQSSAVQASGWFDPPRLEQAWRAYLRGESDNSAFVWQWVSVALNGMVLDRLGMLASGSAAPPRA